MTRRLRYLALWLLALVSAGCQPTATPPLLASPDTRSVEPQLLTTATRPPATRSRVLMQARVMLTRTRYDVGQWQFARDPIGFVRAAFWAAGVELIDETLAQASTHADDDELVFRSAAEKGRLHRHHPEPGDLVFFDASPQSQALYPTQVAIVEAVDARGTVTVLGHFAQGPQRVRFNLRHPDSERLPDGTRLNDRLQGSAAVPAAQLFRAFANPYDD